MKPSLVFTFFIFANNKSQTLLYSSQKYIGVYIIEKQPINLAINQFSINFHYATTNDSHVN